MEGALRLFKSTREYLTPVLTESSFLDRGLLTPEEFVRAGDQLVRSSPSWRWEAGDKAKIKSYLPAGKQFLSTSGVPSYQRVASLGDTELVEDVERVEKEEKELEASKGDSFVDVDSASISDEWANIKDVHPIAVGQQPAASKGASYLDMEEDSLALDASTSPKGDVVTARRYDVTMTYDNYYRTPRIWMAGFDENGSVLSPEAIFEDVIQDYAKRTVTIEAHPHLPTVAASIHPCQHGPAMLTIIQALQEAGNAPSVDQYFFIFLKFIQSVVPTIEYDYTSDVQMMHGNDTQA